ncbi:MAG: glycosyltransferase family 2 protein [Rikenellaceae bacterium]
MLYRTKKIFIALAENLLPRRREKSPKLIMTLLVKNEEKVLEQNLLFHKYMGVDSFIITDNDSSDNTPQIIQKYIDKGWVVESIKDYGKGHLQKIKVDRMIWSAKRNHGADWVINGDADEFWYSPKGDLKSEMGGRENILKCKSINIYPEEGKEFWECDKLIKPIPDPSQYNLSPFNIFKNYTYKVAHSTLGYLKISMGNHKVVLFPARKKMSEITIFHYNILDRASFISKTTKSGPRPHLKKKKKKATSRHWQYFYNLYTQGKLDQEYDRVIGAEHFDEFQKLGYIYKDDRVAKIIKKILEKGDA